MDNSNDELLKLASYVNISSYRLRVVKSLGETDVLIPTQISRKTGILPNHISKVLGELRGKGIVECINPEVRKGRLYRLTDMGREVNVLMDSLH